ncbi:hypothetical protein H5410_019849 [Solanum commersonii]|uniref:MATH domain-containing protein n=1 Tax=Solanum commersonii TaxID=4109 RepID=A0A9J5Z9H7_SOLCO|nr:hypothetical protein H5410_019849 [Solanum commersonii]
MGRVETAVDTSSTAVVAYRLHGAISWWNEVNESSIWQDRIFYDLAILYGVVSAVALVQLIRIQMRVPEYGWTTQKVFHFLNFLVNGVRSLVFVFRRDVQKLNPEIIQHILLDMPSLAFFTTFALLVLFWAEIYYQARAVSTDALRPSFFTINGVVYAIQIILWLIIWWKPVPALVILSKAFFAGVSLFAALGFLLYGGRLFLMLRRFPVESKGRRKKLQEVGYVTTICFSCFLIRCIMMCFNAFDEAADLDVLYHPILNFVYYLELRVGRDSTFFARPFHFEEVASKARDHTVPPYSLIQQCALDDGNQALGSGKMIIHPDGDGDGADHISVYLAIIGPSSLHGVWEVNASFSFLIFDQIHDNYTVMKVMERRFRSIKTEWGLSKCISHETFKNPSNGYLVNDKCIVGVDVYVIKNHGIGECLSLLNDSNVYKHEWKITEFTKLKNEVYSGEFTVEGYKWKLSLYPTGDSRQNGQSISVFLESVDAKGFDRHKSVRAKSSISVKNQISGDHHKNSGGANWYSAAAYSWDWSSYMPCSEINDPKKGISY